MTKPPPTAPVPVDTGKVAGRRVLRFESIDQAMAGVPGRGSHSLFSAL
jgi:hypothetical protein